MQIKNHASSKMGSLPGVADGHLNLRGLCGYVWVMMLTLRSRMRGTKKMKLDDLGVRNGIVEGPTVK